MLGDTKNGTAAANNSTPKVKSSRNPVVRLLKGLIFALVPLVISFTVAGVASSLLHPLVGIFPAAAGIFGACVFFWEGCKGTPFSEIIDKYDTKNSSKRDVSNPPPRNTPSAVTPTVDVASQSSADATPQYAWTPTTFSTDWSMRDGQLVRKPTGFAWLQRWIFGAVLIAIAVVCLALALLPATLLAGIAGYYCLPISGTSGSGAWVGPCPTCKAEVAFSDAHRSAVLTPLRNLCPLCNEPIEIVRDRFVAIPGTGAPSSLKNAPTTAKNLTNAQREYMTPKRTVMISIVVSVLSFLPLAPPAQADPCTASGTMVVMLNYIDNQCVRYKLTESGKSQKSAAMLATKAVAPNGDVENCMKKAAPIVLQNLRTKTMSRLARDDDMAQYDALLCEEIVSFLSDLPAFAREQKFYSRK
jgi:hypothetical protein